ncbi:hypothetical protein DSO57_1027576 [Entomophthora muscae]|uniref:Uncharacterized protein n=1 Tax=Entomophthora muscae TaxID=34485 RepID=A0ACC2SQZ9_9FUNG|nr:hypothetical protein DSO57_1027576 [Entomophthora muscae]
MSNGYFSKGSNDGVAWCAAVCTTAYLMVALLVSRLTILPLWNPRPRSGNQTRNLDPPKPGLWTVRPPARPHFSGFEPLRADVEEDDLPRKVDQTKGITALSEVPITTPNGGDQATISFMSLKSSPATNQEPTRGRGTGLQPGLMTSMLEQDNQVAKLGATTNERTPRPSAILLPLDPSPQFPGPALHNALMTPHKKC